MDRRQFLKLSGAAALWVAAGGCAPGDPGAVTTAATAAPIPPRRPPNIVFLMADDLGYETLGASGGTSYATPVLDGLAAGGMRFDHCYSTPLCTPTRVQLMTGLYGHRNYEAFGILPPGQTTFAHLLGGAGYATGIVGKWQLYGSERDEPAVRGTGTLPEEAGFDEHLVWQVERQGSRYHDPLVVDNGVTRVMEGGYGPDLFAGRAVDFMRRHRDRPFLLYYPMVLPHHPFLPTPGSPGWPPGEDTPSRPDRFAGHVAYMDGIVGLLVQALDGLGIREDTLVVFAGDNGSPPSITSVVGGVEVTGGKRTTTDAGTRVPLVASWSGTVGPGATDALVDFSDFLPPMMALAGAPLPEGLDGVSLGPLLRGDAGPAREWVFMWFDPPERDPIWFVRDRRWKLYGDGRLFDVPADPGERSPVPPGTSEEAGAARSRLQEVLDGLL